jgi:hypothetical protein
MQKIMINSGSGYPHGKRQNCSANPDFITYADSYENADTSTQLSAQPEGQEIDNLTKQGYDGYTQHFDNMWDSSLQGQKTSETGQSLSWTLSNPRVDTHPTCKCEIWVRDVDLLNPGFNKDSEGEPKNPEHIFFKQPVYMTFTASTQGWFS